MGAAAAAAAVTVVVVVVVVVVAAAAAAVVVVVAAAAAVTVEVVVAAAFTLEWYQEVCFKSGTLKKKKKANLLNIVWNSCSSRCKTVQDNELQFCAFCRPCVL